MTNPPPTELVEVTQADRDAAAQALADWYGTRGNPRYDFSRVIKDDHPFVQAFARHRIRARSGGEDWSWVFRHQAPARDDRAIGHRVTKRGGDYEFDGVIVDVIRKRSGAIRYVVEDDRGLLLIMNAKQVGIDEQG